jgi:hypothetical protein
VTSAIAFHVEVTLGKHLAGFFGISVTAGLGVYDAVRERSAARALVARMRGVVKCIAV